MIYGDAFTLDVSADFDRGLPTTLGLTWVPHGMVLDALPAQRGVRKRARWIVDHLGGRHVVTFVATDGVQTARKSIVLNVRSSGRSGVAKGDVTGDGVEDIVVCAAVAGANDSGAVYVWAGGALASAPTARLYVPGQPASQFLSGVGAEPGTSLVDVTGDGRLDVVVRAPRASAGGSRRGAVFVWAGGPALVGQPAPHAVLSVPTANDLAAVGGNGLVTADFNGDGVADVLTVSSQFRDAASFMTGAVHAWLGGPALVGDRAYSATLRVASSADDQLGRLTSAGLCAYATDLDRDGDQDLIVMAPYTHAGGTERGAVYIWKGRSALSGELAPDVTLVPPQAADFDQFGANGAPDQRQIHWADVTGDGLLDLLICGETIDAGGWNRARILVWAGIGSLSGTPAPTATLFVPGDPDSTLLKLQAPLDVTGDGVLDVMAFSGSQDAGALYLWSGGPGLSGTPAPVATLQTAASGGMGNGSGKWLQFFDLTGDDFLDVIVTAKGADLNGVLDCGAIHVWAGGPTLVGRPAPRATLSIPGAKTGDDLGQAASSGQGVIVGDVTGDQVPDLVAIASSADLAGTDRGAVYVFEGGAASLQGSVAPVASLLVSGARNGDRLGGIREGAHLADLDRDGVLDILVSASEADRAVTNAGAVYLWRGGLSLRGTVNQRATLARSAATADERLAGSTNGGHLIHLVDADGNGLLEAFVASVQSHAGGTYRGAVYVWKDAGLLTGDADPTAAIVGTADNENLGDGLFPSEVFSATDVTGDGLPDFRVVSPRTPTGGRVHVWPGATNLQATQQTDLEVPGGLSDDRLGGTTIP